jgi:hypothetical protein
MRIFEQNNDDPNVKLGKHPSVAACLFPHRSWASQPDLPITVRKNRPGGGTCVISLAISCYQRVQVDHMKAKPADRKTRSLRSTYIHALVMYQSNVFRAYTYWYILMRVEIHRWLHSSATCIGRKAHGIPMMSRGLQLEHIDRWALRTPHICDKAHISGTLSGTVDARQV